MTTTTKKKISTKSGLVGVAAVSVFFAFSFSTTRTPTKARAMAPTSALVEALHAGDLASAVRILDAAIAGEEAKAKKASSADDRSNGDGAAASSSSSSSSTSSLRLANALVNRALCHEKLGMLRKALKVRERSNKRIMERERREKRKREGGGEATSRSMGHGGCRRREKKLLWPFFLRCAPPRRRARALFLLFRAHTTVESRYSISKTKKK